MNKDELYSFVMKGELTKISLNKAGNLSKLSSSEILSEEYTKCLSIELLDQEKVEHAKLMATVYTAIAAFENSVRDFISKVLMENKGENWWTLSVSEKIRNIAETRKKEEEKIKWHTQRGSDMINYVDFGDLASIISQNFEFFEMHIISVDWVRQIFQTLERSRNVIMHSGELGRRDVERIGTNIRDWLTQVGI